VAYARLRDHVIGQQPAGFGQRLRGRFRLSHCPQSFPEPLPGIRQRPRIGSEPIGASGVDRPSVQLRCIRVREPLGRSAPGDHRVAVRAHMVSGEGEML
jgi:hypothetical protein